MPPPTRRPHAPRRGRGVVRAVRAIGERIVDLLARGRAARGRELARHQRRMLDVGRRAGVLRLGGVVVEGDRVIVNDPGFGARHVDHDGGAAVRLELDGLRVHAAVLGDASRRRCRPSPTSSRAGDRLARHRGRRRPRGRRRRDDRDRREVARAQLLADVGCGGRGVVGGAAVEVAARRAGGRRVRELDAPGAAVRIGGRGGGDTTEAPLRCEPSRHEDDTLGGCVVAMTEKLAEVRRILDRYIIEVVEALRPVPVGAGGAHSAASSASRCCGASPTDAAWIEAAEALLARPQTRVAMVVAPETALHAGTSCARVRDRVTTRRARQPASPTFIPRPRSISRRRRASCRSCAARPIRCSSSCRSSLLDIDPRRATVAPDAIAAGADARRHRAAASRGDVADMHRGRESRARCRRSTRRDDRARSTRSRRIASELRERRDQFEPVTVRTMFECVGIVCLPASSPCSSAS